MEISKLQWWLTNLNDERFDEIAEEVLDTEFIRDRMDELVFEIISVFKIRPFQEKVLIRFTQYLAKCKSNFNSLKNLGASIFRFVTQPKSHRDDADQVVCLRFLRKLFLVGLIPLDKVISSCKQPPLYVYTQIIFLMVFFTPELLKANHDEFVKQANEIVTKFTLNPQIKAVLANVETLNVDELVEKLDCGWQTNSIEFLIMHDDLAKMKAHPSFSNDYVVSPNVFESHDYARYGCSLIQFAAFYCAEKCFDFLLPSSVINEKVAAAAVAGGNMNIISKVKESGINITLQLSVAAEYRQYEYVKKYITKEVCATPEMKPIIDDVLEKCMYHNNLGLMIFLHNCGITSGLENSLMFECASSDAYLESFKILTCFPEIDINSRNSDGWTPLHKAASLGSLKIIKFLATIPGLDINPKEKLGRTPLHIASACDELEVVAFLMSCTIIDPNCTDEWGRTPLHHAAANNASLVVKFLTKVPSVIINKTDNLGRRPLQVAPDNSECVDILEEAELNLH